MHFFDTTPVGRILNRFSADMDLIDEQLPDTLVQLSSMLVYSVGTVVLVCVISPLFLCLIFPLFFLFRLTEKLYLAASRELKRIESVTKSPVLQLFQEAFNGMSTVRAFEKEGLFMSRCNDMLDSNSKATLAGAIANRWLSVRLESIGQVLVFFFSFFFGSHFVSESASLRTLMYFFFLRNSALFAATILSVLTRDSGIDVGLAGVSITSCMSLVSGLAWLVRLRWLKPGVLIVLIFFPFFDVEHKWRLKWLLWSV